MFNKRRVLYSAMAVALMSGGGNAWAAGLTLTNIGVPPTGGAVVVDVAASSTNTVIATEEVDTASVIPGNSNMNGVFNAAYVFNESVTSDFNVTFTLSGGAMWGADLGSAALKCTPKVAGEGCAATGSVANFMLVDKGQTTDSSVMFLVTGKANAGDALSFSFNIVDKGSTLATSGGEVKLSVDLKVPFGDFPLESSVTPKSVTLVKSQNGMGVSFDEALSGGSASKIDVSTGNTQFISNSGVNSAVASLGKVVVSTNAVKQRDLSASWTVDGVSTATGTITISPAPFNASITGGTGLVFIDTISGGTYDKSTDTTASGLKDLPADTVSDTDASWDLNLDEVKHLATKCSAGCDVIIQADGTSQIQAQGEAPAATASLIVNGKTRDDTGKLRHIKRNGSVCTLYNIPNTAAVDILSVRVTNMGSKEGLVLASLRGLDGKAIFTNQTLVETLAPNATTRIDANALKTLAGGTDWSGRAVLTLSSTIPEGSMEVYGLVRNKAGGPLMNLSAGASGNGCD